MAARQGHYPGRAPIDAYGNGGFRFAEMSHRGSLLLLPDGVHAWRPTAASEMVAADFEPVLAQRKAIELVLLGTGVGQQFPPLALRRMLEAAGIGLEAMSTGAACRTYNVLLGEQRAVAAALIAVD